MNSCPATTQHLPWKLQTDMMGPDSRVIEFADTSHGWWMDVLLRTQGIQWILIHRRKFSNLMRTCQSFSGRHSFRINLFLVHMNLNVRGASNTSAWLCFYILKIFFFYFKSLFFYFLFKIYIFLKIKNIILIYF
jgi:hypothetical protein